MSSRNSMTKPSSVRNRRSVFFISVRSVLVLFVSGGVSIGVMNECEAAPLSVPRGAILNSFGDSLDDSGALKSPSRASVSEQSIELSMSSFFPQNLSEFSQALGTTPYELSGLPALRIQLDRDFPRFGAGTSRSFHWNWGLGFSQLKRSGNVQLGAVLSTGDQTLHLYSMTLGVSVVQKLFGWQRVSGRPVLACSRRMRSVPDPS